MNDKNDRNESNNVFNSPDTAPAEDKSPTAPKDQDKNPTAGNEKKTELVNPNIKGRGKSFCADIFVLYMVIGVIFSAIHTVILKNGYDIEKHLTSYGSTSIAKAFYVIVAAIVLASCLIYPLTGVSKLTNKSFSKQKNLFLYAFCGFAVLAVTAFEFIIPSVSKVGNGTLIPVLFRISGIPFAAFFFSLIAKGKNAKKVQTVLGFFPIIWCVLKLICIYFDQTTPIGDPVKIMTQVTFVSVVCYFLAEQRVRIDKPMPRTFFVISNIAEFFLLFTAIPEVILTFIGSWPASSSTILVVMKLALAGYIASRVLGLKKKKEPSKAK